jgi:hypothetical protein
MTEAVSLMCRITLSMELIFHFQRNDIAMAITKFDQFDFLIDIVPRDELKPNKGRDDAGVRTASMNPDQVSDV